LVGPGDVAERAVGTELRPRMRIGQDLPAEVGLARFRAPGLRPAHEEALIAGEAVDDRPRLAAERDLVRAVRDRETAQVADVLAERELAVGGHPRNRTVSVELLD